GAWPWIAALGFKNDKQPGPNWLCGGTLINDRYIITAAHCTANKNFILYVVRLGELDLDGSVKDGATPLDVRVNKIIRHPSYDSKLKINDIALVKLNRTVPFSRNIQPICLPILPELRSNDFVGMNPFIAGWGRTSFGKFSLPCGTSSNVLMEVQIPIVENDICRKAYGTMGRIVTDKQICAGTDHKDACLGDSGGPLMLTEQVNFFLVGIVSFGYKCGEPNFPGVYTRVTEYIDWITRTVY
ncbi:hypothetical protein AAG570_004494, partial [Ranatra chinensis]